MKKVILFAIIAIIVILAIYTVVADVSSPQNNGEENAEDRQTEEEDSSGSFWDDVFSFSMGTNSVPRITTTTVPAKENPPSPPAVQDPVPEPEPVIVPPKGFSVDDMSSFYDLVTLSQVQKASSYYNNSGSFSMRGAYSLGDQMVDVTGWHVKSNRGNPIWIPQIVEYYSPGGPFAEKDIFIGKSDRVYVYGAPSPVGRSFRLNKCIGYLNNHYEFEPALSRSCPSAPRSDMANLTGRCQSFLTSLWGCEEPTPEEINEYSNPKDAGCGGYLEYKTYNGCYAAHRGDPDFLSKEWRVWVNQDFGFDSSHDQVVLYDSAGKVVDVYTY